MAKGNIDSPKGKLSSLIEHKGFKHSGQPSGKSIGAGSSGGRGVGMADHHKGSSFGGKTDCFKVHSAPAKTAVKESGQVIK